MKPILFNTDMVRALLDGRKSVTRRVVKPQPVDKIAYVCMGYKCGTWSYPSDDVWKYWGEGWRRDHPLPETETNRRWTPPYHTDDILYVRETWAIIGTDGTHHKYGYKADNDWLVPLWHPSIHMPKEAARLFLRVTDVRVEKLQDIKLLQIIREGVNVLQKMQEYGYEVTEDDIGVAEYKKLWDSTIKKADMPLYGWAANPYVWVISFERISKEEALKGGEGNG